MVTTAVSRRVAPVDGIGTAANKGDNSRACLARANLDFDVDLVPMPNPLNGERIIGGVETLEDGTKADVDKFYVAMRRDTKAVLGVVEGRYRVINNREFFDIADEMVRADGAQIVRAAAIEGGARCFMSLRWPKEKAVSVVGDLVSRRAIISNAHSGKFSARVMLIPERLACLNGMVVPVPGFSFVFKIKHTESAASRVEEARKIMAGASKYFETFGQVADRMARTKVTPAHASLILKTMPEFETLTSAAEKRFKAIQALFTGGQASANHEAVRGTAWGLLNAVGEHADYSGKVRITHGNDEATQRFKATVDGSGQRLKLSIYNALLTDPSLGLKEYYKELAATN